MFNLQEAKAGLPIMKRNGDKVKFIAHVPNCQHEGHRVIILDKRNLLDFYFDDGAYIDSSNEPNGQDLVMDKS